MPDFTKFLDELKAQFVEAFPIVSSEEWTGAEWTPEQRAALNKWMHAIHKMFNVKLRPTYDRTIWNGHKSGRVSDALRPVRTATVKDGADKATPDAANIFDEILESLESETDEAETVTLDEV